MDAVDKAVAPRAGQARTAIVTGASRGIGAALARRLGNEGCAVACVARTLEEGDSQLPGSLRSCVEQIGADGGTASAFAADLADPAFSAEALVAAVSVELGPVDYLVNNAAAAFYRPYTELSAKQIDISYRVNVRTPWLLAQQVLPGMIERGSGSVLNLSSATSITPVGPPFRLGQISGAAAYGGSKAWLERATVGAAAELQGTGVTLNTLSPEVAVATEGAVRLVDLSGHLVEPLETMAEAAVALLTGDPAVLNGQVAYSLSLLHRLGRPVHDLTGRDLAAGWQPEDFPLEKLRCVAG